MTPPRATTIPPSYAAPMKAVRTPDDRFDGLPGYDFEPHYIDLEGDLAGLRMHYVDEGRGDPIVLLHGEPTWAYLYRKMIPSLTDAGRVLAPDFVGFGRSDKPTDRDWYTYDGHCDSLVQFLEQLELNDVTLVVQDWGGPIGLRVAVELPDMFARLVILNTGVFRVGPNWPTPGFSAWREFAERNPDLPVGFVIQGATSTDLTEDVIAAYEAPFPNEESKAGAAAFPLLVPLTADDAGAAEMAEVADALTRWEKPTLVAFSDSDPVFPQRAGERLAERIPGAVDFVPIASASHFLQEDKGEDIAAAILDFLRSDRAV
jgi:haloalkane dehalogenase